VSDTSADKKNSTVWKIKEDDPLTKAEIGSVRAVVSNAFEPEDDFKGYYLGQNKGFAIQPPYDLRTLDRLTQESNSLGPCVEAMVTNIDGTGFTIVKDAPGAKEDDGDNQDAKVLEVWDFFAEPWPGESFITQRKRITRDKKRTGNGYLEVIRNARDDIVFTRHVDAKMVRLCKLDDPMPQRVTVKRRGAEVSINLMVRYRRFVQVINGNTLIYFKEFGCPLDLNKNTGAWAKSGERLGVQLRATEMCHFIDLPDAHTPYGVPCWVAQLPSILGSRKAEEFNMEFFDNGGVPPVLVILQGGVLGTESRKAMEQKVSGTAKAKNRVQVIEMEPSGGDLNSPSNARVTVERFGGERQNDSMFEKYDDKCEVRVRRAFRLPPIFVGAASDYSFATAFASYTVGEAQVFKPERDDFDEVMSVKFIPALGYPGIRMKSNPLKIEDATMKLQGIELAQATQQVDASDILDAINETVGTSLKVSKTLPIPALTPTQGQGTQASASTPGSPRRSPAAGKPKQETKVTKPAATPRKSPAVTKEELSPAEALAFRTLAAIRDNALSTIADCFAEIRALNDEELEDLQFALSDMQGLIVQRITEGESPLPN
jgi:PBSX family phage portal protein